MASKNKADIRRGVHSRIRKKVRGTSDRPRLAVFRSVNHIYAQIIDDDNGKTLAAASSTEKDLGGKTGGNIEAAQIIGKAIAERALSAGVAQVVFDRGGYVYHGRVKALIDATREAGLNKSQDNTSEESPADESMLDTVAATVGNIVGTVADVIGNLVGGSAETPAKKTSEKRSKNTDEPETDEVKEEKNENE